LVTFQASGNVSNTEANYANQQLNILQLNRSATLSKHISLDHSSSEATNLFTSNTIDNEYNALNRAPLFAWIGNDNLTAGTGNDTLVGDYGLFAVVLVAGTGPVWNLFPFPSFQVLDAIDDSYEMLADILTPNSPAENPYGYITYYDVQNSQLGPYPYQLPDTFIHSDWLYGGNGTDIIIVDIFNLAVPAWFANGTIGNIVWDEPDNFAFVFEYGDQEFDNNTVIDPYALRFQHIISNVILDGPGIWLDQSDFIYYTIMQQYLTGYWGRFIEDTFTYGQAPGVVLTFNNGN